jgi:glycosyltransferase involved in cell wall biosynthesis
MPRPPTVAHVVECAVGGVPTFVKMLIESQLQDSAFGPVHLLVNPEAVELSATPGVNLHPYDSSRSPAQLPGVSRKVRAILNEIAPDLVVAHSSFAGLYVRSGWRKPRWPVVYCAHGWAFTQSGSAAKRLAYRLAERWLERRTEATINISPYESREAVRAGFDAGRMTTILHGIPEAPAKAVALDIDPNRCNVIYVGRLEHKKGVDRLLAAFDDDRMSGIDLWLAGAPDGDAPPIPSRPNIHVLGWVDHAMIDAHVRQMDAIALPSRYEGLGLVALEGMRAGKAVIANRVGGLKDIVEHGHNGLFIEIENLEQMRETFLALSPEHATAMGRAARESYERFFSWPRCYQAWRDVMLGAAAR